MSLTDNAANVYFASSLLIDKIIGTYSGSFVLNSSGVAGGTNTVNEAITTNIPETTFFQGIYSIDNGVNWNGFGTINDHVQDTDPLTDSQGSYLVEGLSQSGTFTVRGTNSSTGGATLFFNYTVLYKVALIAKSDQGDIDPQPTGANTLFDSRLNYQKIAVDNKSASSGTNQTVIVAHNLGYIPKVRVFRETSGILRGGGFNFNNKVNITETIVSTLIAGTVTCDLYTRIYYDG